MLIGFTTFEKDGKTMLGIILDMDTQTARVIAKNNTEEASGIVWDAVYTYIAEHTNNNFEYDYIPLEAVLLARKLGFRVPDAKRKGYFSKA